MTDTESMARAATAFSWAHRGAPTHTEAALAKCEDGELDDIATTTETLAGWVRVEQLRRLSERLQAGVAG
jgi:hypothetical protein